MEKTFPMTPRPCPICGGNELTLWREGKLDPTDAIVNPSKFFSCTNLNHGLFFPIRECNSCRFKFCSPCPDEELLDELYSSVVDETYLTYEDARRIAAKETLKRIPRKNGKLLEVGCYTGAFLLEAKNSGFDCYGIEPSRSAIEICRGRGLRVNQGLIDQALLWDEKFDLIVMWDVLEHLYDPLGTLKAIRNLLAPDGEFHFTTLRIDCLFARLLGTAWPWYMPMHISYFERESLTRLCQDAGFRDIEIMKNFHYSSKEYLLYKLKSLSFPLNMLAGILRWVPRKIIRISLGDTVYVKARV